LASLAIPDLEQHWNAALAALVLQRDMA
jgi:hypothetical protein